MEQKTSGSKSYLISIVMVAVLGGLLFGYDTAVISGAEKGLQAFFTGADFSLIGTGFEKQKEKYASADEKLDVTYLSVPLQIKTYFSGVKGLANCYKSSTFALPI